MYLYYIYSRYLRTDSYHSELGLHHPDVIKGELELGRIDVVEGLGELRVHWPPEMNNHKNVIQKVILRFD